MKTLFFSIFTCFFSVVSLGQGGPVHFDLHLRLFDGNTLLRNKDLSLLLIVSQGASERYIERHQNVRSDGDGFVVLDLGRGDVESGSFNTIEWHKYSELSLSVKGKSRDASDPTVPFRDYGINDEATQSIKFPVSAYAHRVAGPFNFIGSNTTIRPDPSLNRFDFFNGSNNDTAFRVMALGSSPSAIVDLLASGGSGYTGRLRAFPTYFELRTRRQLRLITEADKIILDPPTEVEIKSNLRVQDATFLDGNVKITNGGLEINGVDNALTASDYGELFGGSNHSDYNNIMVYTHVIGSNYFTACGLLGPSTRCNSPNGIARNNSDGWDDLWQFRYIPARARFRTTTGYSLKANSRVAAQAFHAFSDKRIKKLEVGFSPNELHDEYRQLEVVRYRYIDKSKYGSRARIGFVAQQLESLIQDFVVESKEIVPDILAMSRFVEYKGDSIVRVYLDEMPLSLEVGDRVKVIGEKEYLLEIASIGEYYFELEGWPEVGTKNIFVYGREVPDFKSIDNDQILALTVSVTQELINEVEMLEEKIKKLEEKYKILIARYESDDTESFDGFVEGSKNE